MYDTRPSPGEGQPTIRLKIPIFRGAPRGHGRFSAIPPMPRDPRRELELLRDHGGPLGFLLWRIVSDLLLWIGCPREDRGRLFHPAPSGGAGALACLTLAAPELRGHLEVLLAVSHAPELAEPSAVAEACGGVVEWAERNDMKETAVQYAEAAARIEPEVSARSYTAGRLCRRLGAHARSGMWYNRAARLARRAQGEGKKGAEIDFANAHFGLGNLEHDLGQHARAEQHFSKAASAAMRVGRKSLAAMAHHSLVGVTHEQGRAAESQEHAEMAASYYPTTHPCFPLLAHDVGFLWLRQGYFSSAIPIFEKALPWVERQRERILVLASLARSAAAVKDHIRYERAASEVVAMAAIDNEQAASSLYHLAEGARSFWEWERAERLATWSLDLAEARKNGTVIVLAQSLLTMISARELGDVDRVPLEGGAVDRITALILDKLQRRPAPETNSGAVPPDRFLTD